jgi:hypothetical protein
MFLPKEGAFLSTARKFLVSRWTSDSRFKIQSLIHFLAPLRLCGENALGYVHEVSLVSGDVQPLK